MIRYLALEEEFWKQKAGMLWFKDGDRNTKFFHVQVKGRRKKLQLKRIKDNMDNWIEDDEQIAEEAIRFYKDQFTETIVPNNFHIMEHVPRLVEREQNENLIATPTREEVKRAVYGLNTDSAGGPDGYTGAFYHACWDIIGEDVYAMVLAFFNGQQLPKVIHERLVELLPNLISEEQAGFVKGRSIVENVLLTQEIITDMRLRTKAGPNVVINLDMTKAYDRLSWLFLTKMLRKFGFCERFIGMVYDLVGNNWYSVLVNGQSHGFFKSSRGVKQGDPLSPTLFILAAEALSRGLNSLHSNLYFCGFGLPKWSPKIKHLAYADDTIIFSSSDATSLRLMMEILYLYEAASGQLVNKSKSAIYMHHLVDLEVVRKVERVTGVGRQHKIFAQFFWSSYVRGSSRHWASWNTLCMPCEEGGIGFRSLHDASKALFCKLWWNFRTKPSLWSSFVSQKYCKKLNAVVVPWRRNGSHEWRKMLKCRELIEHQIFWRTKMGFALFWYDNWTELGALYFLVPPDFGVDEEVNNVYELVDKGSWNVDRLMELLPEELALHIVEKIRPPVLDNVLDTPVWMLETKGHFSVKSAWEYLRRRDNPRIAYRMIWVQGFPFKISFFMRKVWRAKLPLDDFMRRLGYHMPSRCWCCAEPKEETLVHLFFTSKAATMMWK
ncbi:PREDICTED: uncharacterized protein LOC109236798 [Nicotiana attenuata]|uniref:uncharacterized protein LOC109236798 n=1 Tax=Nicotiana attenuata TaxID=49451 RepID=UPI000904A133|nr:PREDICTED: uncharacterized protein LOC109236798 [Nicotiana attenuata]